MSHISLRCREGRGGWLQERGRERVFKEEEEEGVGWRRR